MQFSNVVLCAAVFAITLAFGWAADSTFTYHPNGKQVDGELIPGPNQWGGSCNNGSTRQSPIAITTSITPDAVVKVDDYTFDAGTCTYNSLIYESESNGVKVTFDPTVCVPPSVVLPEDPTVASAGIGGIKLNVGTREVFGPEEGKKYSALQFHIHSGSEHTIDGMTFGAEMHIVHAQEGTQSSAIQDAFDGIPVIGSLLGGVGESRGASVVGFVINGDAPTNHPMFEYLLAGFEDVQCGGKGKVDKSIVSSGQFNPYAFLDASSCIMNYDGSLTTPSCDEIVEWNLAMVPVSISSNQMTRLLTLINGCNPLVAFNGSTSRPIQPLEMRPVNHICPSA